MAEKEEAEVLERRDGMRSADTKTELHVHHTFYDGRKPWKYPKSSLTCLCKDCHQSEHSESEINDLECPRCNLQTVLEGEDDEGEWVCNVCPECEHNIEKKMISF